MERIALIGAGLGATQVIDILAADESKMAVAIVDDDKGRWADQVAGVPVVGGTDELKGHSAENRFDSVVIAISTSVPARTRFRELCGELGIPLANAIDPSVRIAAEVELGAGNVVCAFCHFGVGTRIGDIQLSVRAQLLRSSQRRWDGHLDRTRLHDLGPDAYRRSGAPWDGNLH